MKKYRTKIFGLEWYCTHCGAKATIHKGTNVSALETFVTSNRIMIHLICDNCFKEVARSVDLTTMTKANGAQATTDALRLMGKPARVKINEV